ncbi:MAG: hypothetical protein LKJ86_00500 [Oscillibacter sp.]|jgi:hypothetical protein|nr:hypothetical protein [Oscillibacter sp.]
MKENKRFPQGNALSDEELDNASDGLNGIGVEKNPMPVAPGVLLPPSPGNPTGPTLEMPESPVTPASPFRQNFISLHTASSSAA